MRRTGKPTNLYLNQQLKVSASETARMRYGCSLSELVEQLLRRELSLKRGLLRRAA